MATSSHLFRKGVTSRSTKRLRDRLLGRFLCVGMAMQDKLLPDMDSEIFSSFMEEILRGNVVSEYGRGVRVSIPGLQRKFVCTMQDFLGS